MNEIENKKINKKITIIIVILSIIIVLLLGYILCDKLILKERDKTTPNNAYTTTSTTSTTSSTTTTTSSSITTSTTSIVKDDLAASEIIALLKDYSKRNNLYDETNTKDWNITSVTYLGYYKNKVDEKIYVLSGNFNCKDNTSDCVYMEQELENNSYKGIVKIKDKKVAEMLPPTFDAQVKTLEKDQFVIIEQKIK